VTGSAERRAKLELPPLSVEAVRTMAAGTDLDAGQLYSAPEPQLTRNIGRYSLWSPRWADRSVGAVRD